jgi:hypothetical protein
MAEGFARAALLDTQTTITSLSGALGGVLSEKLGSLVIDRVGDKSGGLGATGLEFIVRAAVSSGVYLALVNTFPETADNILFSILFFGADSGLTRSAIKIANDVVRFPSTRYPIPDPRQPGGGKCSGCQ